MKKRITALVLAMTMSLSMTACGKKEDKSKDASATDAVNVETTTEFVDDGVWTTTEVSGEENEEFTVNEGDELIGLNFDDNTLGGFATYTNGGAFTLYPENGEMVADITNTGSLDYANQMYFDGFRVAKGCVYTLSFDVYSTDDRIVEWRVQLNGGDYHAYASDKVNVTSEKQTVTMEFAMEEESDLAPRFVVNMGKFEGQSELQAHKVYFDNISLVVTDTSNAEKMSGTPTPIQVKVNQVGYAPEDVKTVIVTSKDDTKFKIVDVETEETVFVAPYTSESLFSETAGVHLYQGDFTAFQTPGRYKIISCPSGASYEFSIGEGLYDDVYKDVVLMLYNQRCGLALEESVSGNFAHNECHMQEAIVYGDTSGKTYDVSGGWHDAGDYGRYVVPGAKTVQDLFLAYEDYNQDADDIGIPESGNGIPDLLDEAKYELDWMFKMQDEATGGVYHKVTGLVFPETVAAVDETAELVLAPVSYAATADFAAVMAKASVMYRDIDSDYASKCLEAAKNAYAYLEDNANKKGYKNPGEIVTGEYSDEKLVDEYFWAATELYLATLEDTYLDTVKSCIQEGKYYTGLGWAQVGTYPLYDLAKAEGIDESVKTKAKEVLLDRADKLLGKCKNDPLFTGMDSYGWGSNMEVADNGVLLLMAYKVTSNEEYLEYAKKQRDYLFGLNGTGYCYVTGYGTLFPISTHHRPSQVLGETMPGMLVGGPNGNLEDPYAQAVLNGYADALCYVDNEQSYSCNEVTIYWNSPLIYLLTGLQK